MPNTKPIVIIVEETGSLPDVFLMRKINETRKQIPHIKAKRDKNNSQRISDFRLK